MIRLAVALVLVLSAGPAAAEKLVVSLSTKTVLVTSNFAGSVISLAGVVERDAQTVSRAGGYDIVVVARGPDQDILVQRKERRFGIWINARGERFSKMPSYYGLFTSPRAARLVTAEGGAARNLSLARIGGADGSREELRAAIARQRVAASLFVERSDGVEMLTDTFFSAEIPLPAIAVAGAYTVYVFLYADGVPLDTAMQSFTVEKAGIEQRLFEFSQSRPLAYGLLAAVLAVATGYVGGILFRR